MQILVELVLLDGCQSTSLGLLRERAHALLVRHVEMELE
jgi:hypothetical protein